MSAEPRVEVVLTRDPEEFAAESAALFAHRLDCNIVATVLDAVRAGHHASSPLFAYARGEDGAPCLAALRTPPWPLLAGDFDPSLADALLARWRAVDPDVPAVSAPGRVARALAQAWQTQTGGASRCIRLEAMHATDEITDPPFRVPGDLRVAERAERALLIEWMADFLREALDLDATRAAAGVDSRLEHENLFWWERNGVPVSLVGLNPPVSGVVRVGPVYTPPELRGNGYASAAVAAVSRTALDRGARTCMLFTDLANPTSNKIYAQLGYRRCGDWEEHEFASA